MSDTAASLRRQIDSATDLQSVVRTMKAIAAASIGQYERSVRSLVDYEQTVRLGLGACLRRLGPAALHAHPPGQPVARAAAAVVFGSDQGLVGRFNEVVSESALQTLAALPGQPRVWAVGERVHARLLDAGLAPLGCYAVPASVDTIAPLVGQILLDAQAHGGLDADSELLLFHNTPALASSYESHCQRLLPLDGTWSRGLAAQPWPTMLPPEVTGDAATTLAALIGEYLFVSLFRACAASLASENASRLAAMERADQSIEERLAELHTGFHRLRQDGIDAELSDVLAGFEALGGAQRRA